MTDIDTLVARLTAWHECDWNHVIELRKDAATALTALQAERDRLHKQYLAVAGDKINLRSEDAALRATIARLTAELEAARADVIEMRKAKNNANFHEDKQKARADKAEAALGALIGAGFSLGVRAAEKLYVNHGLDFDASLADQMLSLTLDSKAEATAALESAYEEALGHCETWAERTEAAEAERDAAVAEADRLRTNRDRFPELMAQVMAEKNLPLPDRIERLKDAIADLAPNIAKYQWVADEKPAFGERYIRHVAGDNGEGMGRQWLASCPPHIKGLAEYIAAANPDTVSMLLADIAAAVARAEKADGLLRETEGKLTNAVKPDRKIIDILHDVASAVMAIRAALPDAKGGE